MTYRMGEGHVVNFALGPGVPGGSSPHRVAGPTTPPLMPLGQQRRLLLSSWPPPDLGRTLRHFSVTAGDGECSGECEPQTPARALTNRSSVRFRHTSSSYEPGKLCADTAGASRLPCACLVRALGIVR